MLAVAEGVLARNDRKNTAVHEHYEYCIMSKQAKVQLPAGHLVSHPLQILAINFTKLKKALDGNRDAHENTMQRIAYALTKT